jgi:exonuclease VII small subunit
MYLGDASEL